MLSYLIFDVAAILLLLSITIVMTCARQLKYLNEAGWRLITGLSEHLLLTMQTVPKLHMLTH